MFYQTWCHRRSCRHHYQSVEQSTSSRHLNEDKARFRWFESYGGLLFILTCTALFNYWNFSYNHVRLLKHIVNKRSFADLRINFVRYAGTAFSRIINREKILLLSVVFFSYMIFPIYFILNKAKVGSALAFFFSRN